MRAWSIAKRIMTEMLRDKRTLALMFVAPIIIITMLNVVFFFKCHDQCQHWGRVRQPNDAR